VVVIDTHSGDHDITTLFVSNDLEAPIVQDKFPLPDTASGFIGSQVPHVFFTSKIINKETEV
jgi:hypothetical protein